MQELWQLYNEDQKPVPGKGATKDVVFGEGLLHGSAHVWIWRRGKRGLEVLVQKRAAKKRTWPNMLDIPAAGHIDLGETPEEAAIRETMEEIDLKVTSSQLDLVGIHRMNVLVNESSTENEFRWIYLMELENDAKLSLQESEVSLIKWVPFEQFAREVLPNKGKFVPQGNDYFTTLLRAMESLSF